MKTFLICAVALITAAGLSCKEPLPQYRDPRDVFDAYLASVYVCSPNENVVKVFMTLVNTYDETFDARALLRGRLTISWGADVSFRRTVALGPSDIVYARGYNPDTGVLRIDPGDSIRIVYSWNLVSDFGRSLRSEVPLKIDPSCPARRISVSPVPLFVDGTMSVYERTETVAPTTLRYDFTLVLDYVGPRDC